MFEEGRSSPIQVAIALNLREKEVSYTENGGILMDYIN